MAEGRTLVRLEGDCGIERAAEIKEKFLSAMAEEDVQCLELDLSAVTRADASLQQIICAAHRSLDRKGWRVELTAPPAEALLQVQRSGGFGRVCMFRREDCPFQGGSSK